MAGISFTGSAASYIKQRLYLHQAAIMLFVVLCVLFSSGSVRVWAEDKIPESIMEQLYDDTPEVKMLEEGSKSEILSLRLSQSVDDAVFYTFSDARLLSGSASPGDTVAAVVYTLNDRGVPIIWYNQETEITEAGIYQENIPLQLLGTQWLMLAVCSDGKWGCRIYECCRKSEEIRSGLLEYELNLYEEFGRS